jgi:hypothetical protein
VLGRFVGHISAARGITQRSGDIVRGAANLAWRLHAARVLGALCASENGVGMDERQREEAAATKRAAVLLAILEELRAIRAAVADRTEGGPGCRRLSCCA